MFLINDLPAMCPHCGADIPRQQVEDQLIAKNLRRRKSINVLTRQPSAPFGECGSQLAGEIRF